MGMAGYRAELCGGHLVKAIFIDRCILDIFSTKRKVARNLFRLLLILMSLPKVVLLLLEDGQDIAYGKDSENTLVFPCRLSQPKKVRLHSQC